MSTSNSTPEPSPFIQLIAAGLTIFIMGYGSYWLYQQLEKVDIWVNYIKVPFFIFMGIGFLGFVFLYGMAGIAMYKNAKDLEKEFKAREKEEDK